MDATTITVIIAIGALIVSLVGVSFNLFFSSRSSHKDDVEKETNIAASQAAGQVRLEVMLKQVQDTGEATKRTINDLKNEFSATREDLVRIKMNQKSNLKRLGKHNKQINDLYDRVRDLEEDVDKSVQCQELIKKEVKKEGTQ